MDLHNKCRNYVVDFDVRKSAGDVRDLDRENPEIFPASVTFFMKWIYVRISLSQSRLYILIYGLWAFGPQTR
jgi:hypothetical protein